MKFVAAFFIQIGAFVIVSLPFAGINIIDKSPSESGVYGPPHAI